MQEVSAPFIETAISAASAERHAFYTHARDAQRAMRSSRFMSPLLHCCRAYFRLAARFFFDIEEEVYFFAQKRHSRPQCLSYA